MYQHTSHTIECVEELPRSGGKIYCRITGDRLVVGGSGYQIATTFPPKAETKKIVFKKGDPVVVSPDDKLASVRSQQGSWTNVEYLDGTIGIVPTSSCHKMPGRSGR